MQERPDAGTRTVDSDPLVRYLVDPRRLTERALETLLVAQDPDGQIKKGRCPGTRCIAQVSGDRDLGKAVPSHFWYGA